MKNILYFLLLIIVTSGLQYGNVLYADIPYPYDSATDNRGMTWYCYAEGGRGISSFYNGEWQHYTTDNSEIASDNVYRLVVDSDDVVWMCFGIDAMADPFDVNCIASFDGTTWKTWYDGLIIHDIAVDHDGVVWVIGVTHMDDSWNCAACFDGEKWTAYPIGRQEYGSINYISVSVDENNVKWFDKSVSFDGINWERHGEDILYDVEHDSENSSADPENWFPLDVGNTWTYHRTLYSFGDTSEDTAILQIIGTREIDGKMYAAFLDGRFFRLGDDGNYYEFYYGRDMLRFDLAPCEGDNCDPYYIAGPGTGYEEIRVSKEIEVPLGTFSGYGFSFGTSNISITSHFLAPGIGMVRYGFGTDYGIHERWELVSAYIDGTDIKASINETGSDTSETFKITGNHPNPFNPLTTIEFTVPSDGYTNLIIYNIMGQRIRTLNSGTLTNGNHSVIWDGRDDSGKPVSSGVYFSRLLMGEYAATGRMLLLR